MKPLWNRFAVFALAGFATLLAGCGGNGGANGAVVVAAVVPANVSVTLPAGFKPSGALSLSGGLFGTAPLGAGNTQASIKAWNKGSELVAVLDSSGNPLLLGWIGGGNNTINTRTTADVLTYFAIEGYGAPNENQDALLAAIAQQGGGATVATEIAADVAAGKNLGSSGVTFASNLKALALSLVNGSSPGVIRALTPASAASPIVEKPANIAAISPDPATPAGTQSGITINPGTTTDTLVATNGFRRRVLLFVDRNDTFDGSTPPVTTPAPISVSETELVPAVGGVNGNSFLGNLTSSIGTTSSAPLALLAVPAPQFGSTYDVIAVGPGASNTQPATLSTSEVTDAQKFLRRTFFTDFFLPIMNRICISDTLTQMQSNSAGATTIANLMDKAADAQAAGVDAFVIANFGSAQPQMFSGDFLGANASVLATINGTPSIRLNVANYYSNFLQSVGGGFTPTQTSVGTVLGWMSIALQNVNVSNLPVALPQYDGVTKSQVYSSWTVTQTTGAVVTLTPTSSSITTTVGSDTQTLTASINFGAAGQPAKSTLLYSWTTPGAHGDMVFPDNTKGTTSELNSTYSTTQYFADLINQNNSGTDIVTVTATLKMADGTTKQVGVAKASVAVNGTGTGNGFTLPVYALRSASGSAITVSGGTFKLSDLTTRVVFYVDFNKTSNPIFSEGFWNLGTSALEWLYLTNEPYLAHDSSYGEASSGDTIQVVFDCPAFAGQTSIGIDQDAHLYSPTGKDLGVEIPKFTSTVGGSDGYYDGGSWIVLRNFTVP